MRKRGLSSKILPASKRQMCLPKVVEIKDLIRIERQRRGWSQRALARALGVSNGLVAQWETGLKRPGFALFVDICNVFGLSVRGFTGPDGPYQGEIVDDPDEMTLLTLWRALPPEDRPTLLRLLAKSPPGRVIGEGREAQPSRKGND